VAERRGVDRRRGDAILVHIWRELLRRIEMTVRDLQRQLPHRIPADTGGKAVERRTFDVVTILIRFPPAEAGRIELPVVQDETAGHHAKTTVGCIRTAMVDSARGIV